jgi:anti-anti-sigma factor
VSGEIDMATVPELEAALRACDGSVCVDLSGVTFMDSSGLAVLLRARKDAAERGAQFEIANPVPNVRRVFQVMELEGVLST